jgi:MFS family permease
VVGALLALAAFVVWIYSDCVYRFVLLETVVTGQCRLRDGWRRWKVAGRRYFAWAMTFACGSFLLVGIIAGVPALLAYRAGWFANPEEHLGLVIGWGILLVLVLIIVVASLAIIDMLGRDFLVPVMAFERVGPVDGWRKLFAIMDNEKLACFLYVLMKTALAMGAGVVFAIVNLMVVLILLIPLGLVGLIGYFIGQAAGFSWDLSAELLIAALGLFVLVAILYLIGFVYVPGLVFFQSYTLEFFASRYGPLGTKLQPLTPPVTPPPVTGDVFPA